MIRRWLRRWLGIQELADQLALLIRDDQIIGAEIVDKGITGVPVYPPDDPHPFEIVKGYDRHNEG